MGEVDRDVQPPLERIHVHPNGRFLVTASGKPFFWMADTAWELFHRLNKQEIEAYLANRAEKSFTVIQAVILAEFDGLTAPNIYGDLPLVDQNPSRPNETYFRLVDWVVKTAASYGLYIGLLPTWGDKVAKGMFGAGPVILNPENARIYGRWLGERYREDNNILSILGGDRPVEHGGMDDRSIYRALAEGIEQGTGGQAFMTFHPHGGYSSSFWLHKEPWLDMNMMQSGHSVGHDTPTWEMIAADYARDPAKPVLDGEPNYEDHPVSPWPVWDPANGYFRDHDVRKQAYRSCWRAAAG